MFCLPPRCSDVALAACQVGLPDCASLCTGGQTPPPLSRSVGAPTANTNGPPHVRHSYFSISNHIGLLKFSHHQVRKGLKNNLCTFVYNYKGGGGPSITQLLCRIFEKMMKLLQILQFNNSSRNEICFMLIEHFKNKKRHTF